MKIMNLTPDSFSDGGELTKENLKGQIQQAPKNWVLDFGAESTAPFNDPISYKEEIDRFETLLYPCLNDLKDRVISIDTYKPKVFFQIHHMIRNYGLDNEIWWNDVSGIVDEDVHKALELENVRYIYCHNHVPDRTQTSHHMKYVKEDESIESFLESTLDVLAELPLDVIFDPCFGFAKSRKFNLDLMEALPELLDQFDHDLIVGVSRKSFLRRLGESANDPIVRQQCETKEKTFVHCLTQKSPDFPLIVRTHNPQHL